MLIINNTLHIHLHTIRVWIKSGSTKPFLAVGIFADSDYFVLTATILNFGEVIKNPFRFELIHDVSVEQ